MQGNLLKKARRYKGMTQQEVADAAGVHMRHYQMFKCGARDLLNASFRIGMAICNTLDIEPEALILALDNWPLI